MKINLERIYKNKEDLLKDIEKIEKNIPKKVNKNKHVKREVKKYKIKLINILDYTRIYLMLNSNEISESEKEEYIEIQKNIINIFNYLNNWNSSKKRYTQKKGLELYKNEIIEKRKKFISNYDSLTEREKKEKYDEILRLYREKEKDYPGNLEPYILKVIEKIYLDNKDKIIEFRKANKLKDLNNSQFKYEVKDDEIKRIIAEIFTVFGKKYYGTVQEALINEKIEFSDKRISNMNYQNHIFVNNGEGILSIRNLIHELRTLCTK